MTFPKEVSLDPKLFEKQEPVISTTSSEQKAVEHDGEIIVSDGGSVHSEETIAV